MAARATGLRTRGAGGEVDRGKMVGSGGIDMRREFAVRCVAASLAAVMAFAWTSGGADLRFGGAVGASFGVLPVPAGDVSLELSVGLGPVDVSSWTEYSLFPYVVGSQTFAVSVAQDWLGLNAEYRFSLVPLGITRAAILARARPLPWDLAWGDSIVSVAAEGEARLTGDSFASALRTEVWAKASVGASRAVGCLDRVALEASVEVTLSAPGGGRVWPTPALIASATFGRFTLESETSLSVVAGLRIAAETVSLAASWGEIGLSGSVWCTLSGDLRAPSLGIRLAKQFGDAPIQGFRVGGTCAGGVCH